MRTVVVVAVVLCLVAFAAAASKKYDLNKKETKLFVEWLKVPDLSFLAIDTIIGVQCGAIEAVPVLF